jgi:hypothetical protein
VLKYVSSYWRKSPLETGDLKNLFDSFMKTNVQYLFDMHKLLRRPTPDQGRFEEANFEFLKEFVECSYDGFEQTKIEAREKPPLSMNFSWFAHNMNGNVLAAVARDYPEAIKYTGRHNYSINLPPNYECYIKKLKEGSLLPSYNHSVTSSAMCDMLATPTQKLTSVIFIGYTLDKNNSAVTGCYAVCIKGNEKIWVSDLTCLRRPQIGVANTSTPITPNLYLEVRPREVKKKKAN